MLEKHLLLLTILQKVAKLEEEVPVQEAPAGPEAVEAQDLATLAEPGEIMAVMELEELVHMEPLLLEPAKAPQQENLANLLATFMLEVAAVEAILVLLELEAQAEEDLEASLPMESQEPLIPEAVVAAVVVMAT